MSRRGGSSEGVRAQSPLRHESVEDWEASESLVEHWCAGDEDVVDAVWKTYRAKLTRRLRKRFRSLLARDEREEVVSAAIGHDWEHCEDFLPAEGALEAWLWTITYHQAAEVARKGWCKQRCRETPLPPEKPIVFVTPVIAGTEDDGEAQSAIDVTAMVELAMSVLSAVERTIILADMHSPTGTAPSDVLSQQLRLTPSTIRCYRRRARKKLKDKLISLGYRVSRGVGGVG